MLSVPPSQHSLRLLVVLELLRGKAAVSTLSGISATCDVLLYWSGASGFLS